MKFIERRKFRPLGMSGTGGLECLTKASLSSCPNTRRDRDENMSEHRYADVRLYSGLDLQLDLLHVRMSDLIVNWRRI